MCQETVISDFVLMFLFYWFRVALSTSRIIPDIREHLFENRRIKQIRQSTDVKASSSDLAPL